MISSLLALALSQDPVDEPPILRVGETLQGELTDADPVVHTPTLDKSYTDAPTLGKTFLLEVDEPGTYCRGPATF